MFEKSYTPKNKCFFRFWNLWGCHIDLDMRECYTLYIYSISVRDCYFSYLKCLLALEKKAFCMPRTHSPPKPKNNQDSTILLDSILVFSFWYTHVRIDGNMIPKPRFSLRVWWNLGSWFLGFGGCQPMPAGCTIQRQLATHDESAAPRMPERERQKSGDDAGEWRWGRRNGQRWNRPAS